MIQNTENLRQIDIVKIYADKKCIVIDDFPEIRGSLTRMLKTFGAESVETAADGDEAIKLCQEQKFDIVLCDYNLGAGKDGQQILEEVRHLRVVLMTSLFIMITGESSREMVLGAIECQPDDYIMKPYTQASLKVRLDKAILRHQALLHIKTDISNGDYDSALKHCNQMIISGSRYAPECLKMKGQLHFLLEQLEEAKKVYRNVLSKKPVMWAKLGMCKTLIAANELDKAEELLQDIIEEDGRYIEAHDMLAEVYEKREDTFAAQKAKENATKISPKSVLRHRKLAKLAEQNNDDETALKSFQQSIKWGFNSCHESPQDYFNYARKAAEVTEGDNSTQSKTVVKQANTFLERARKRYSNNNEVNVQTHMVETQLLKAQGNESKAAKAAEKAKELFDDLPSPAVETSLEYARTLTAMDEEGKAREVLKNLALRHSNDKEIMQIIDSITSEPISDGGKKVAAKLTKKGIHAYEEKEFDSAIKVFKEALTAYPKHTGLNLNLVQAVISATESLGYKEAYEKQCIASMRAVGKLENDHKQFKRYAFINKQLEKYYPKAIR